MPRKRNTRKSASLQYGNLEQRQLMAFNFLFDGSTLTLNQSANDGVVTIDNSGPADEFRVNDGAGFVTYEAADNLVLNLMDNSSHLTLSLNSAHNGDVTVDAGDGARNIVFASASNSLDGQLSISAGSGSQSLSLAQISDLDVGGGINIDTGLGHDSMQFVHSVTAGGDLEMKSVNDATFDDAMTIDGNVLVDNSDEVVQSQFDKSNPEASSVSGRFTYIGNNAVDNVSLQNFDISGDVNVDSGRGITPGGNNQSLWIFQSNFNNLTFKSGNTTNLDFATLEQVLSDGDIDISMGEGQNIADVSGFTHGDHVNYSGLGGVDSVLYEMGADATSLNFSFGDGDDSFALNGTSIVDLEIDFGPGDDTFMNPGADFSYDARLINLDGLDVTYEASSETLSFDQRDDAMNVSLELQSDPLTDRLMFEGNDITTTSNLSVSMHDNNLGSFDFYLEHQLIGDLEIDLGHGQRLVDFLGAENRVNGDFSLTAGDETQEVYLDTISGLRVVGETTIDLGTTGDDLVQVQNVASFGGDVNLVNVDHVDLIGGLRTDGDLNIDVASETNRVLFHVQDQIRVDGDINLSGSDLIAEQLWFDAVAASFVLGSVNADFGGNDAAANSQFIILGSSMSVASGLTMTSTNDQTFDFIRTEANSQIAGDIFVDLGDGTNIGNFRHEVAGGEFLQFVSGAGNDEVVLNTSGLPMSYNFVTGAGNDVFTLEASPQIGDMLRVDFGGGDDQFVNNKGAFTWDTRLLDLHGFNNFYDPITDSLRIHQRVETQDFAVSNDNPASAFVVDLKDGSGYELTPAANLQIHLEKDSTTNMGIDLHDTLAGDLELNLGQNSREIHFVGTGNTVNGNLWVQGGQGDQSLYLSSNQDLTVAGDTMINLRQGSDGLFDDGNAMQFDNDFILRNVDNFEVSNSLTVGGNMAMESLWFKQDVLFDNNGTMQVDGKFTYLGSDGFDKLSFGGNAFIGDDVFIRLEDNTTTGEAQIVGFNGGFEAGSRVSVVGGSSSAGNIVVTDDNTVVGGDMIVNFTGSTTSNTVVLKGHYGGSYGTFRGGEAADTVVLDAIAEDMFWGTLMDGGDDELTLDASSDLLATFIDFGLGEDLFADNSVEDFPKSVVNFP